MNAMTISIGPGRQQRSAQKICGYLLPPCGMRIKCPSFAFLAFFAVISDFRFSLFQASLFPPVKSVSDVAIVVSTFIFFEHS
ncbi:MAG TPA: hypothetical protein VGI03_10320 [Verrucomicrobiae bacterium]|jgi:hypothetical protein